MKTRRFNYFYNGEAIPKRNFTNNVPENWEKDLDQYGNYSDGYYSAQNVGLIKITEHEENGYNWLVDICEWIDNQDTLEEALKESGADFLVNGNGDLYIVAEDEEEARTIILKAEEDMK